MAGRKSNIRNRGGDILQNRSRRVIRSLRAGGFKFSNSLRKSRDL